MMSVRGRLSIATPHAAQSADPWSAWVGFTTLSGHRNARQRIHVQCAAFVAMGQRGKHRIEYAVALGRKPVSANSVSNR
jgi:hypothetical protein